MSAETLLAGNARVGCRIRGSSAYEDRPVRSPGAKHWRSRAGDIKKRTYFSAAELPKIAPPTLRPSEGHELGTRHLQAHVIWLASHKELTFRLSASIFNQDSSSGRHKYYSAQQRRVLHPGNF